MVDIPGNSTTTRSISVGGSASDALEVVGDHDWFRISLTAGQSINVFLDGMTLEDSYLRIYDSNSNLLFENDDINPGIVRDSQLAFTATYTGTYYIDVGAWQDGYAGTYQLSVTTYTPPPVAPVDQIADQLVNGYWGGDDHHFNVTQGGSITVNITALTAAGQALAVAALQTWTDIIGVNFVQVAHDNAQITFDDNQEGAFSNSIWSNGIISSSDVNVSTDWLATYGTGLNTYSFQTYIHEIGHALGLGHAGNYNGDASFPYDALFLNDGWPVSVMSYFSPTDSNYYSGQGFTENYLVTPMLADILAMSSLYGLSTTTRTGNTTYGFNSTAGNVIYNASLYPNVAYTIFDNGGTDTLDYSGFSSNQLINLNPDSFSSVGNSVGNVTIARGVVIENAIGGSGNDKIVGNAANNVLTGGGGTDTVSYETSTAAVTVNLTTGAQQNTIGAGLDTLIGFEQLIGSAFNDTLTGSSATVEIHGGAGNDLITSTGLGSHRLYGDGGDDLFVPSQGDDWMVGGDGFDTVDYSSATGPINATTDLVNNNTGGSGADTIIDIEKIVGSNFNDTLWAFQADHQIWGGGGNDTLRGSPYGASQLYGGSGDDTYEVRHGTNQIIEAAGEGIDLVVAETNFTLAANVENLILLQPVFDPYAGATISGPPFADFYATGNDLANVITGNRGANLLSGMAGNDTLSGGEGNDTLDGGTGADAMAGGLHNDIYVVDNAGDAVTELAGEGTDLVNSSISWTLGSNLENLTLTGAAAINGTGNSLANVITGNNGANVLNGGLGADQLIGGAGDDIYYVDQAGDVVTEAGGEGTDEVRTALSHTLGSNLENLRLSGSNAVSGTGNALSNIIRGNDAANSLSGLDGLDKLYGYGGNDTIDGGSGDDYLYGLIGNDSLTGGTGYDRVYGGVGDDTYHVTDATDFTYELAGEGTDLVIASLNHQLRNHVENLTLTGAALIGKGNDGDNEIAGNGLNNRLYGYGGNDTLDGSAGDDIIDGREGNDTLIGGIGYDKMHGGLGDDIFIVNDATDFAYELAGQGHDKVFASVTHRLRDHIEELQLTGIGDIRGYGNAENNLIIGNSGANLLYGRDGNDTLLGNAGNDLLHGENGDDTFDGGAGQDRYYGGAGADSFVYKDGDLAGLTGSTADRIMDFSQVEGDKIDLSQIDADTGLDGDQGFSFIGAGAFTGAAGQLRTFQAGGVTYLQGDTDGDGTADFLIRIDGLHTLQESDFII